MHLYKHCQKELQELEIAFAKTNSLSNDSHVCEDALKQRK